MQLEVKIKNKNKTSCFKYFPNMIKRYTLAKQFEGKINEIKGHCNIALLEFSRLDPLDGMRYYSFESFVPFESR